MIVATKRAAGSENIYPYYFPGQSEKVRVRVRKQSSPQAAMIMGVLTIMFLFCAGLSFLFIKAMIVKTNYHIAQVKIESQNIMTENEKLKVEISKLKSLERIEAMATAQLGMTKEPQVEYLVYSANNGADGVTAATDSMGEELEQPEEGSLIKKIAQVLFKRG